jgi:hypothetical protein
VLPKLVLVASGRNVDVESDSAVDFDVVDGLVTSGGHGRSFGVDLLIVGRVVKIDDELSELSVVKLVDEEELSIDDSVVEVESKTISVVDLVRSRTSMVVEEEEVEPSKDVIVGTD